MSFDLHYINVQNSNFDPVLCFTVTDFRDPIGKKVDLCIRKDNLRRYETPEMAREGWIKSIMDFKNNCVPRTRFLQDQSFNFLKDDIRREAMMRAKEKVQEKSYETNERQIMGQLQQQNVMAQGAMAKEMRYEQLAVNEEILREEELEKRMEFEMEKEKLRQNCFTRDMDIKQRDGAQYSMNQNLMYAMQDMRNRAANLIQQSRLRVKQRLMALRKVFEERRIQKMQKMMEMKSTLSNQIVEANKLGDSSNCNPHLPISGKLAYCQTNFQSRPDSYSDCQKSSIDFCYVCCDNEFGGMFEEKRESCYHQCVGTGDSLEAFAPLTAEGGIGATADLNGQSTLPPNPPNLSQKQSNILQSTAKGENSSPTEGITDEDDDEKPEDEDFNSDEKDGHKNKIAKGMEGSIMPSESGVMEGAKQKLKMKMKRKTQF